MALDHPDHPDNAPPNLDIGKGSPTAVKFGTRNHFPRPYRDALYVLDWAYGRVLAVHMVVRGSSYLMNAETLLKGRPLNVTDLEFGPDGAMYFVTGGRQTQSALYRVTFVGTPSEDKTASTLSHSAARETFARDARRRRRTLEAALTAVKSPDQLDAICVISPIPTRGSVTRLENLLERYPIETWIARSMNESDTTIAIQSLMVLARRRLHAARPDTSAIARIDSAMRITN